MSPYASKWSPLPYRRSSRTLPIAPPSPCQGHQLRELTIATTRRSAMADLLKDTGPSLVRTKDSSLKGPHLSLNEYRNQNGPFSSIAEHKLASQRNGSHDRPFHWSAHEAEERFTLSVRLRVHGHVKATVLTTSAQTQRLSSRLLARPAKTRRPPLSQLSHDGQSGT